MSILQDIFKDCPNGFYVYAKPALSNPREVIQYIARYLGRPVIATSRIDHYDGVSVTVHYNKHEDDAFVSETVPAADLIKRLIIHIPDKHFKMIRYYGLNAKRHKNSDKLFLLVPKQKRRFHESLNTWKTSLMLSFGYNTLWCECGHSMTVLEIRHKGAPLFEIDRKLANTS